MATETEGSGEAVRLLRVAWCVARTAAEGHRSPLMRIVSFSGEIRVWGRWFLRELGAAPCVVVGWCVFVPFVEFAECGAVLVVASGRRCSFLRWLAGAGLPAASRVSGDPGSAGLRASAVAADTSDRWRVCRYWAA